MTATAAGLCALCPPLRANTPGGWRAPSPMRPPRAASWSPPPPRATTAPCGWPTPITLPTRTARPITASAPPAMCGSCSPTSRSQRPWKASGRRGSTKSASASFPSTTTTTCGSPAPTPMRGRPWTLPCSRQKISANTTGGLKETSLTTPASIPPISAISKSASWPCAIWASRPTSSSCTPTTAGASP